MQSRNLPRQAEGQNFRGVIRWDGYDKASWERCWGTVQVTLGGLPSGVTSNPSSPFNVGAGSNTSVVFGAATSATTGTFTITAQGTSGALSHLSNGKLMMRLRQAQTPEALLALWDPLSNIATNLTPTEPQLFQNGLGAMARTGDRTKVLVAANDTTGELAEFDSNGNVVAGPHGLGVGRIPLVAANVDGSRFAVAFNASGNLQVLLLDGSLSPIEAHASAGINGMVFSTDGSFLYVSENAGAPPVITVLDGHDLHLIGQVADLWIQGGRSEIEEADETKLLFSVANRGVSFVDAATPGTLPTNVPSLAGAPSVQPSEGPNTGGTATILAGQNFEATAQVQFGGQPANNVGVTGNTQITATSPPNVSNGAVNVAAYFPSGWMAIAPDAFSYGPEVMEILPNAGAQAGGETLQIYGYGFGTDPTKVTVKIGGVSAVVQSLENVTTIAASLGLGTNYPFPLERITVTTAAGSAGKADVLIASPAGTTTAASSFQYLQGETFYAKPALEKFIFYDQKRQWLYLSNIDHVDVFDLAAGQFRPAGIQSPGSPPNAGLRGLALTPDSTKLVVADFGAQNVYLINPDDGTGTSVRVGGVPGFLNSGPARVAATSAQTVFVGLSGEGGSGGACTACLGQLDLTASPPTIQPAPQPQVTSLIGAPLMQASARGDHVFVAFGSAPGGPLAVWDATAPNQFTTTLANATTGDIGAAADGTVFALWANGATEIRAADLLLVANPANREVELIPGRVQVPGVALHPSGALIYQPFLTGPSSGAGVKGGVDILDAHSGALRLRIHLPQQLMTDVDGLHGSFLAVDENGQRLFAITSSNGTPQNAGLTIVTLAEVPLGIGTLTPSTGTATGGTALTIRGSGFKNGVTVSIGGKSAAVTFKDANTLNLVTPAMTLGAQRVTITNPDGESVSSDAAFTAQ